VLSTTAQSQRAGISAEHRAGQTFVTFTETGAAAYDVYRNGIKIATLDGFSGTNRYTDQGLVICDGCPPLAPNQGLLVWTPKASGEATYEVRAGGTSLGSARVQEIALARPGVVRTSAWSEVCGQELATYLVYDDYETWEHGLWGPYFHEFVVSRPAGSGAGEHVTLYLHPAGGHLEGYNSPLTYFVCDTSWLGGGIVIVPVDFGFVGVTDPYIGAERPAPWWSGYGNSEGVFVPWRERQLVRITQEIAAQLQADANRLYVVGNSMGGQAAHLAYHHPQVFAAAWATVGMVGPCPGDPPNPAPVDAPGRPSYGEYYDLGFTAPGVDKPPLVYHYGSNDVILPPCMYPPAFQKIEQAGQALFATWAPTFHEPRSPAPHLAHTRFRKDEAYPAFSNASGSSAFGSVQGQRNQQFDWSDIVDTANRFEITIRTVDGSTQTVDVTIRNRQAFKGAAARRGVAVTPRGTRLVFADGDGVTPAIGRPAAACVAGGACGDAQTLAARRGAIEALAWMPDGRLLFIEDGRAVRVLASGGVEPVPALTAAGGQRLAGLALDTAFERTRHVLVGEMTAGADGARRLSIVRYRELQGRLAERAVLIADLPLPPVGAAPFTVGDDRQVYVAVPGAVAPAVGPVYAGYILAFEGDGRVSRGARLASPILAHGLAAPAALVWEAARRRLWIAGSEGEEGARSRTQRGSMPVVGFVEVNGAADVWPRPLSGLAALATAHGPAGQVAAMALRLAADGGAPVLLLATDSGLHGVMTDATGQVTGVEPVAIPLGGVPTALAIAAGGEAYAAVADDPSLARTRLVHLFLP
jgi:hypothetical protein